MIQSAVLMTSRLCSMTSAVLPVSTKVCSTSRSLRTSSKCSPVVGSWRNQHRTRANRRVPHHRVIVLTLPILRPRAIAAVVDGTLGSSILSDNQPCRSETVASTVENSENLQLPERGPFGAPDIRQYRTFSV